MNKNGRKVWIVGRVCYYNKNKNDIRLVRKRTM
jgi:hypothetical protein